MLGTELESKGYVYLITYYNQVSIPRVILQKTHGTNEEKSCEGVRRTQSKYAFFRIINHLSKTAWKAIKETLARQQGGRVVLSLPCFALWLAVG